MTYDPKTKGISFQTIDRIIEADLDPSDYNISKDDIKRYYDFKKQQEDSKKGNRFGGKIKRKKKRLGGKITYNY